MALAKELGDKVEVLEDGQLQIRTVTRILEDGINIAETYHRKVLEPGQSTAGESPRVVAVANAVWTAAVIQAYKDKKK